MYCRCGPKFDFNTATKQPAPADWQAREVWVCGRCKRISHAVQEERPVMRGPSPDQQLTHAVHHANGQRTLTWVVNGEKVDTVEFFPWDRRFPMTETEPLIYKTWELLMSKVNIIMRVPSNELEREESEHSKHQARGIAEVLAIQMKPFMESADHVVRCAVEAYKDPNFQVPGLGKHLWDPMRNPDGSLRVSVGSKASTKSQPKVERKTGNTIPDSALAGVKGAVSSGMFTLKQVAATYSMTEAEVRAQLALD